MIEPHNGVLIACHKIGKEYVASNNIKGDTHKIYAMTEYYTTQSLATAAAAFEQGFEGVETYDKYLWNMEWRKVFDARTEYEQWRFPKTPHNVALMELQHGDLVTDGDDAGYFDTIMGDYIIINNRMEMIGLLPSETKIVYRNNKPFPVWDKEEV